MQGKTISHYKVLEKIGGGGMGEVFLAEDTSLERKVALKFLPESLQQDETAHKRFLREAKSAAALDHPYICHINEVRQHDGQDFIVMEYVQGKTLQAELAKGPLPIKEALRIGVEVAEALEVAHQVGIVHRDLKPSNVMLTPQGHAKVMDFGLAKKVVSDDGREQDITSALTKEGSTLGTLAYMSPEQIKAVPVDSRADIFSFGIVLYEMLTGVHPFRRASVAETTAAILEHEAVPLTRYSDDISELLQHTLSKMLAKHRQGRYQSIHEVRTNLMQQLDKREVASTTEGKPSVAVLPFVNMSGDPEQEYFGDGLAEELLNALTKLEGLRVAARTSSFHFKGKTEDIRQIGKALSVNHLLEGSVRKAGSRIRVTAQLVKVCDGYHLWSERYDRQMEDIFDIQDEIARKIVGELRVKLIGDESEALVEPPTKSIEAYELYLKGQKSVYEFTSGAINRSLQYYAHALQADSDYALAYAGIALARVQLANFGLAPSRQVIPKAREAALKAIEIDEDIAESHLALALIHHWYDWDWEAAEAEYTLALTLEPNNPDLHTSYAQSLVNLHRTEEGLRSARRAVELDPLSLEAHRTLVLVLYYARVHEEAIEESRKAFELAPNFWQFHLIAGLVYWEQGKEEEALRAFSRARDLARGEPMAEATYGMACARVGERHKAVEILERLKGLREERYFPALYLAWLPWRLGDLDETFKWMEIAYEERDGLLTQLAALPGYDSIREDPRFQGILRRMNFPGLNQ